MMWVRFSNLVRFHLAQHEGYAEYGLASLSPLANLTADSVVFDGTRTAKHRTLMPQPPEPKTSRPTYLEVVRFVPQ
jgi:hypothetical protein